MRLPGWRDQQSALPIAKHHAHLSVLLTSPYMARYAATGQMVISIAVLRFHNTLNEYLIAGISLLMRLGDDGGKFCAQSISKEGKCECGVSSVDPKSAAEKPK